MTSEAGIFNSDRTSACTAIGSSDGARVWNAMSTSADAVNSTVAKPALKVRAARTLSSSSFGIGLPVS
ncbi:hypothetical protein D3C72_2444480 [compost metagenome]